MKDQACPSFEQVFEQFHQPVLRYVSRITSPDESEEVCQDVFEKISRNLDAFQGKSSLSTWVYKIATNTALDHLRKKSRQPQNIPIEVVHTEPVIDSEFKGSVSDSPIENVISSQMNDCIREQVDKLPEKYRMVMALASLEELDQKQIATILDISLSNVKTRLHRARAMLKEILKEQCQFYSHPETGNLHCDRKQN